MKIKLQQLREGCFRVKLEKLRVQTKFPTFMSISILKKRILDRDIQVRCEGVVSKGFLYRQAEVQIEISSLESEDLRFHDLPRDKCLLSNLHRG